MLLSDNILRCVAPEDRATLGKADLTGIEACVKTEARVERQEHNVLMSWLQLNDLVLACPH